MCLITILEIDIINAHSYRILEYLEKRKIENDEISNELDEIEIQKDKWIENQKQIYENRDNIENEKEKIEEKYNELKNKILHLEDQIKKYRKQHASSMETGRHIELKIQENQMKSATIKDRIDEEYNEDITIGIAYNGLNVEEFESNIESLKFKIKQLGQVNPIAVSEYEKESDSDSRNFDAGGCSGANDHWGKSRDGNQRLAYLSFGKRTV